MSKKTVVLLGKTPPPYMGPSIATEILINSRLKEDFNLHHINTKLNNSIGDMGSRNPLKIIKNIPIYIRLLYCLKNNKTDLTIIPISQTTIGFIKDSVYILIASFLSRKTIIQLRGSDFKNWVYRSNSLVKMYVNFVLKRANGAIVLGKGLKQIFSDYFQDEDIYAVPNGGTYIIPEKEKKEGVTLLYLANFIKNKGFDIILEAIHEIITKNRNLNVTLIAAGSWDDKNYERYCKEIIEKNKLPVKILPPASGENKMKLFANADIFVFVPRAPEGLPWVLIEALASSLPIISTNQGAISDCVLDNYNGYLIPSDNWNELSEKLSKLLVDSKHRKSMGDNSHLHYTKNFTEEIMIKNFISTIHTVTDK